MQTMIRKKITSLLVAGCLFTGSALMAQSAGSFQPANIKTGLLKVANWQLNHSNGKPENTDSARYLGAGARRSVPGK